MNNSDKIDDFMDKYYSRKFINEIQQSIMVDYDLDFKTIYNENIVRMQVKKRNFEDEQYYTILVFECKNAFKYLVKFDEVKNKIRKSIEYYSEKER